MRRKTPHNFIFLGLFTLAEGFMLGTITARYDVDEVQYINIRLFTLEVPDWLRDIETPALGCLKYTVQGAVSVWQKGAL